LIFNLELEPNFRFSKTKVQDIRSANLNLVAVIVKYNSSGLVQWAKAASGGDTSHFYSVAINNSDDIYVVGKQVLATSLILMAQEFRDEFCVSKWSSGKI